MATASTPLWDNKPAKHDYPAAANYLSLIADPKTVAKIVADLKKAPIVTFKAKDVLRAARLELLGLDDAHVKVDLVKVIQGVKLSPVLIVRGDMLRAYPTTIADGYHRVCASYHIDENTDIPCRIVDLPVPEHVKGT